ncbi:hypothetical protein [Massilia psychrophila]|uniref:Uncharacterized protein n=1 Tax=Massilia psychrophila TaxID=1603353 RepID=A0A2G8SZC1_9BURK|nr:hypothetical protein [Massilia psychrophila]PIL39111.1 hypothetical protein CR103_14190 [Massilia psychrophila]
MCILASITAALLCWPLLAVLALRRTDRLASHPVLFAKTSHLFLDEYLAVEQEQEQEQRAQIASQPSYGGGVPVTSASTARFHRAAHSGRSRWRSPPAPPATRMRCIRPIWRTCARRPDDGIMKIVMDGVMNRLLAAR